MTQEMINNKRKVDQKTGAIGFRFVREYANYKKDQFFALSDTNASPETIGTINKIVKNYQFGKYTPDEAIKLLSNINIDAIPLYR